MRLSLPYIARGFSLTLVCALLLFMPPTVRLLAQATVTPQPTPIPLRPSSQELEALDSIASHLETLSATSDQTTNAAVLILGSGFILLMVIVLILAVWIVRGGLKPLWETITAERRRADNAEVSETHMRVMKDDADRAANEFRSRTAAAQERTADAQERTVNILANIETSTQAQQRTGEAVKTINDHTEKTFADAKDQLVEAATHIEKAASTIDGMVTKNDLHEELTPIKQELRGIADLLRKKGDTGELDPAKVPSTDPAAVPDIWQGDNPDEL